VELGVTILDQAIELAQRLPAWLRPSYYGALIIGASAIVKSIIMLPMLSRAEPIQLVTAWLVAMLAGAIAGAVWTVSRRWLMPIPVVGPYLSGIITIAAYMAAVLIVFVRFGGLKLTFDLQAFIGLGIVTVVVGLGLGYALSD
jgi:hypothetical protein